MEFDHWDFFLRLRKRYAQVLEPVCRRWDLTRNELDILLFLANNPGFDRAADIVERRGMAKSHVSMAVQSLERRGFLRRVPEPEDRRSVHLQITPAAAETVSQGQQAQRTFFERIFHSMTPEELRTAWRLLEKVCENMAKTEER